MTAVGLGVVGCGYVADFYAASAEVSVPEMTLVAAADRDWGRVTSFTQTYGGRPYGSIAALLADPAVQVVLNLTPPGAHREVSLAALRARKHVYSEKPLATSFSAGQEIIDLARACGLAFGCAPSVAGSQLARTMRALVADGALGKVSHLYCEVDDGPLHRMDPQLWRNSRGVPWPYGGEFADGPVLHHLPYAVTWAVVLAGSAIDVMGVTSPAVIKEKLGVRAGPDLCVLIIKHISGCTSRLTIGTLAPRNRSLMLVGSDHVAEAPDVWSTDGPLLLDGEPILWPGETWPFDTTHRLDFASGIRELAQHIESPEATAAYTNSSGALALHVLEICSAFRRSGMHRVRVTSRADTLAEPRG